jgi:hypothetical protein
MTIYKHLVERNRLVNDRDEKQRALHIAEEKILAHDAKRDPVYDGDGNLWYLRRPRGSCGIDPFEYLACLGFAAKQR